MLSLRFRLDAVKLNKIHVALVFACLVRVVGSRFTDRQKAQWVLLAAAAAAQQSCLSRTSWIGLLLPFLLHHTFSAISMLVSLDSICSTHRYLGLFMRNIQGLVHGDFLPFRAVLWGPLNSCLSLRSFLWCIWRTLTYHWVAYTSRKSLIYVEHHQPHQPYFTKAAAPVSKWQPAC